MVARIVVVFVTLLIGTLAVEFQLWNKEIGPIWVGVLGNPGHANLGDGGLVLQPDQRVSLDAAANWRGHFWARTWCNSSNKHCDTGDCSNKLKCNGTGDVSPVSLAEIALKSHKDLDYYDVSLVDGFNMMIAIQPLDGKGDDSRYSCKKAGCQVRLIDICPEKLKVRNDNSVIACNSACKAFHIDEYCCRGAFNSPTTCTSSIWPENYPAFFKKNCPDAYSYAYDDRTSTFTCRAEAYLITFGPDLTDKSH